MPAKPWYISFFSGHSTEMIDGTEIRMKASAAPCRERAMIEIVKNQVSLVKRAAQAKIAVAIEMRKLPKKMARRRPNLGRLSPRIGATIKNATW